MKTLIICLFLAVSTSFVYAEVQLHFKDGRTLIWSDYTEEDGSYCTWKAGGQICIPKKDIVSVKEVKEEFPGATVITPQPRSAQEEQRDIEESLANQVIAEQADQEAKRREMCAEILRPNALTNSSSKGFASSLIGLSAVIGQRNAYNDCLAGVSRQPARQNINSRYRYQGISGKKYQYDLGNPSDRIQYEVDPGAQLRDSIDSDPRRGIDQGAGQYGGGSK